MECQCLSKSLWRDCIDVFASPNAVTYFILLHHDKRTPQLLIYKQFTILTNQEPLKRVPKAPISTRDITNIFYGPALLWLSVYTLDTVVASSVRRWCKECRICGHTLLKRPLPLSARDRWDTLSQAPLKLSLPEQEQVSEGSQMGAVCDGFFSATKKCHWQVRVWFGVFDPMPGTPCAIAWPSFPANPYPDTLRTAIMISKSQIDDMARTQGSCFWFVAMSDFICTHLSKTKFNNRTNRRKAAAVFCNMSLSSLLVDMPAALDEYCQWNSQDCCAVCTVCVHCDAISCASALTSSSCQNDVTWPIGSLWFSLLPTGTTLNYRTCLVALKTPITDQLSKQPLLFPVHCYKVDIRHEMNGTAIQAITTTQKHFTEFAISALKETWILPAGLDLAFTRRKADSCRLVLGAWNQSVKSV